MAPRPAALALALALAGCLATPPAESSLELDHLDSASLSGWLRTGGSEVAFEATSLDQRRATLRLDVNGAVMRFEYDVAGLLIEDGQQNTLYAEDRQALLALRDALGSRYPQLVQGTLQGRFLARHADWLADAPEAYLVETRQVDVQAKLAARAAEQAGPKGSSSANTTGDDSSSTSSCLRPGSTYRAYYDAGNGGAQWYWDRVANSGRCLGRCGAGCNIFDTDLMLDCFEHDTCVDHFGGSVLGDSPNCGDEFSHAAAEYLVTYGPWCPY